MEYARHYQQVPNNDYAILLMQDFPSKTSAHFAYEAGLGLAYLKNKLLMSLEYKFQDLGSAQFGLNSSQQINDPLKAPIYSNQLLLNFTYLI